jgi:hypothetical protein
MADEDFKDYRKFTLGEAEKLRNEMEPVLIEAMESRRKMAELEANILGLTERIMRMGGITVPYEKAAQVRLDRDREAGLLQAALERIHSTGCLVKDLDVGLLDFPARLNNEDVFLCWRLGEDRIRFYHSQDEGFSGRKPIDPRDAGYQNPIQ